MAFVYCLLVVTSRLPTASMMKAIRSAVQCRDSQVVVDCSSAQPIS